MKETLYIRIGSQESAPIQWLITNEQVSDEIASGTLVNKDALIELTDKAAVRDVKVLVDGADVRLKSLTVPGKSERAIKSAAPYMMEDALAQDVDELFFAFASKPSAYQGTDNCFVAFALRAQVETWLSWFKQANIVVRHMMPDILALPLAEDNWTAISIGQQLLLRTSVWDGLVVDQALVDILMQQLTTDAKTSQHIVSYAPLEIDNANIDITYAAEELPMLLLARGYQQQSFNFLQGGYQIKQQRSPVIKNWLWVAAIAMLALTLNLSAKVVNLMNLNAELAQITSQIETDYKKAFPATKKVRINTIKRQLNSKMAEYGGSITDAGLLELLDDIRPAFIKVPKLKPESLRYDGKRNEIRLSVTADDYQSFEKFKAEIEKASLQVETGAQNNQGDQVVGSFNIRSK